jgi:hypothetical protein
MTGCDASVTPWVKAACSAAMSIQAAYAKRPCCHQHALVCCRAAACMLRGVALRLAASCSAVT